MNPLSQDLNGDGYLSEDELRQGAPPCPPQGAAAASEAAG